jgi:thiol-disulfide isomerase/thioredoxin
MTPTALMPRLPVPTLEVKTVKGATFNLSSSGAENFTLVVFYRGLHCPICAKYLIELERLAQEYINRGVKIIAISTDNEERAKSMAEKVSANLVEFGYGLTLTEARNWGLYISSGRGPTSIGIEEPALFGEPGVFLVRPDGTLYYGSTQTMPFARPSFQDLLAGVDFAITKNYPARGEYSGEV